MSGHIDDVVNTALDPDVAMLIPSSTITGVEVASVGLSND